MAWIVAALIGAWVACSMAANAAVAEPAFERTACRIVEEHAPEVAREIVEMFSPRAG